MALVSAISWGLSKIMEHERTVVLIQVFRPRTLEAYLSDPADAATHCLKAASLVGVAQVFVMLKEVEADGSMVQSFPECT